MFVLKTKTTYRWPVSFQMPNSNGEMQRCDFTAEFVRLSQDVIDEYLSDGTLQQRIARSKSLANSALVGWTDVHDLSGEPVPYSEETKEQLLAIAGVRVAVVDAFFESINGHITKN